MKSLLSFAVAMIFFHSMIACEKCELQAPPIVSKVQYPQEAKVYPIVVIGSGAAGMMAVKRAVLNNDEVLLFIGSRQEQRQARGTWVRKVDNIPGLADYDRTLLQLRDEVLEELASCPLSHNLYAIEESVCSIEKEGDIFKLSDGAGRTFYANYVVLTTGIMNEQPCIQGSIRPIFPYANGQAIGYCTVCDGHRCYGKKTAVIGHTESAAYTALRLSAMYHPPAITILTNGYANEFSTALLRRLQAANIIILEAPIQEVNGNKERQELAGFLLETGDTVEAEMGFISLGIIPNNQLARQLGARLDDDGLVITDADGESSVPNLFVAGDLRSDGQMQIYSAWQEAVDCVQEINWRIRCIPAPS